MSQTFANMRTIQDIFQMSKSFVNVINIKAVYHSKIFQMSESFAKR